MELKQISIRNFKGIEYKELEFRPGINIIKGENGTGKTSILEAIASGVSLNFLSLSWKNKMMREIQKVDKRCIYKKMGDGGYSPIYSDKIKIDCQMKNEGYSFSLELSSDWRQKNLKNNAQEECAILSMLANSDDKQLPILLFEDASRELYKNYGVKDKAVNELKYIREDGYRYCMAPNINIDYIKNWCSRMEQISWQKEIKISEYEAVKEAVADFMNRMDSDKNVRGKVYYEKQSDELLYGFGKEMLPITSLSSGYQSLIWMVFDIAYRMAVLNPFMKEQICKTSGIVLIDEIDLHLHPKWQWNVLEALHAVFPEVQFIVTTHSPIIIASMKESWILDIENEEVEPCHAQYGLDINDTLTVSQASHSLPLSVIKKVDEFNNWIAEENLEKAEEVLSYLEKEVGTKLPVVVEARVCLDMEQMNHE